MFELGDDEHALFSFPCLAMFGYRHVELERPDLCHGGEDRVFVSAVQRCHPLKQRFSILRLQIRRQLQLVLAKQRRAHVALQVLPGRLVVQRLRHQLRDLVQRGAFGAHRRGCWLGRDVS